MSSREDQAIGCLIEEVEELRKRVQELERDELMIIALQSAGVDNWTGYDHALDIYRRLLKEEGLSDD